MASYGADTTTDEILEGIDLTDRRIVITGASSGLGEESARALAARGAQVTMLARDPEKNAAAADRIRAQVPDARLELGTVDLADFDSIRAFAGDYLADHDRIDVLMNNAGVMACPLGQTADGFEMQFGTNHLGHFLMTGLIAPALLKGAPARVVSLSSRGHQFSPVVFDDIPFERRAYDKWLGYGQAKTANVLLAVELERRLGDRDVHAYAVHPGVIATDLARHLVPEDYEMMRKRAPGGQLKLKSVEAGAATSVYAATAPELEGCGALYLEDCHVAQVEDADDARHGVRSYALDPGAAARLWSISEEMVGQTFAL